MLRTPVLLGLGLAALATAAHGQTFFVDTFSSGFSGYNTPSGRSSFSHTSAAGVGGALGALVPEQANNSTTVAIRAATIGSFDGNQGQISVSVYFRTTSSLPGGTINMASVGITNDNSSLFASTSTNFSVDVRGAGTSYQLRLRQNDGSGNQLLGSTATLAANTWYQLFLTATHDGGSSYTLSANLFNWGSNGVTGGGAVANASVSTTFTSNTPLSSANLFAGFLARGDNGTGTAFVDNFQVGVIPEPSSAAALAGLAVLGGAALRRRRR
jgi:hypothetical protein